jgi:hypothetical protein
LSDEKKLSIAALSQTLLGRLIDVVGHQALELLAGGLRGFKRSSQHSEIGDCDEHLHSKAKIGTIWTSAIAIAGAAAGGGA